MNRKIQIIILVFVVVFALSMILWDDVQEEFFCHPCPQYSIPSPDFCKNGTLVSLNPDSCGCYAPPKCFESFDENSWREIIPDSCRKFSDGCNTCTRTRFTDNIGCTEKGCFEYQMPKCLD